MPSEIIIPERTSIFSGWASECQNRGDTAVRDLTLFEAPLLRRRGGVGFIRHGILLKANLFP